MGVRRRTMTGTTWAFGLLVIAALAYPLGVLVAQAFEGGISTDIRSVTSIPNLSGTLFNTGILDLGVLVIAMSIGTLLAIAVNNLQGVWRTVGTSLSVAPVFLPPIAAVMGWVILFSSRIGYGNVILRKVLGIHSQTGPIQITNLVGITVISGLYLVGYVFLFISAALQGASRELESASRVSGAGWWRTQFTVVLPQIRPALFYSAGVVLLLGLGQFTAPLVLGANNNIQVLMTEIYEQFNQVPQNVAAATTLALPLLLVALGVALIQRRSVGRFSRYATTGVKGSASQIQSRRRWVLVPVVYFVLVTLPPLLVLALVSVSPFWTGTAEFSKLTLNNYRTIFTVSQYSSTVWSTLVVSLATVVVAVSATFFVALIIVRSRNRRLAALLDLMGNIPLGLPGVIIGLAVFVSYGLGRLNLQGTWTIFVIAFVLCYFPFALRTNISGIAAVHDEMRSAARISGASPLRELVQITFPLTWVTIVAAAIQVFALTSHDFAAASILATATTQVLTTGLYTAYNEGSMSQVAALSMVLVGICLVVTVGLMTLGAVRRRGHE